MTRTGITVILRLGMLLFVMPFAYALIAGRELTAGMGAVVFAGVAMMLLASGARHIATGHFRHATARARREDSPVAFWILVILVDFVLGSASVALALQLALRG